MFKINISIERNKDGFLAIPTDVGGVHCQAKTRKEAIDLLKKTVETLLLDYTDYQIQELKSREIFTNTIMIDLD